MTSKYSSLPDIDSAPDVFETPDEPDLLPHKDEENNEDAFRHTVTSTSKDIDTTALPSRNTVGKQFGSLGEDNVIALPEESRLARLRLLRAEIAELESEIEKEGPTSPQRAPPARASVLPPRSKVNVLGQLSSLRTRLSLVSESLDAGFAAPQKQDVDLTDRLRRLEIPPQPLDTHPTPPLERAAQVSVGDVDKRLASLEDLVGIATAADEGIPLSLTDSLSRLGNLLNILTQPRHLDGISRRVKMLLNDMERAGASARRNAGAGSGGDRTAPGTTSQADQDALQSLFSLIPRLDPLLPAIPPLVTRLRSLSALHAEALDIAADLRELQSIDANASEEEHELNAIVEGVQRGLSDAAVGIQKNWEALQGRIQALEGRLETLG